jgi:hypothetical protein
MSIGIRHLLNGRRESNMTIIQKSTFCAILVLCSSVAFANNTTNNITHSKDIPQRKPQSMMTLASADFQFSIIEEHDGRVLVHGRRGGGIKARRVSLRR